MRVTVVRPGDLGPSEADLWAKFQASSPVMSSPFMSLTFAQAVDRFRPAARVAVVEDGGQIEAFLPFERAALATGVPIGHPMNDLHGFIGSGAPIDARLIVRRAGLRGWRFAHAPAEQRALAPFHYDRLTVQAPVIDLTNGYHSYFGSRSKNFRKIAGKKRRALERQLGALSLEWGSSCPAENVLQLIDQKSGKYYGTRHLFSDQTALRIVEELATANDDDCQGIVSVVFAGEKAIARFMGIMAHRRLSAWFASYDPDLSSFSPGMLMYLALAEEGAGRGITLIDLCSGQDVYKFHLANDSYPVAAGAVWVSRTEDAARKMYRRIMHSTSPGDQMPAWARSRLETLNIPDDPGEDVKPVPLTEPE
jgi:CelD/BcsL family acetyltransferase involved in cellulose biosynthesis